MTAYRIKFSPVTLQSSVHSMACNVTSSRSKKEGVFTVEAKSAQEAAKAWSVAEELQARGLSLPKVCGCCG
jgi:hypothetical protein